MKPFKPCVTQKRGKGSLTKKVTKRVAAKKVMPLTQKISELRAF